MCPQRTVWINVMSKDVTQSTQRVKARQIDPACWFHDESWHIIPSVTWAADSQSVDTGVAFKPALPLSMQVHPGLLLMFSQVCVFTESHGKLLDVSSRKAWGGTSQAEAADWPTWWRRGVDGLKSSWWFWCAEVLVSVCSSGGIGCLGGVTACGKFWNSTKLFVFISLKFLILKPFCGFIQKLRVVLLANTVLSPSFGN